MLEGYDVVDKIQDVDKQPGDKPTVKVVIVKSGELESEGKEESKEEGKAQETPKGTHGEL